MQNHVRSAPPAHSSDSVWLGLVGQVRVRTTFFPNLDRGDADTLYSLDVRR